LPSNEVKRLLLLLKFRDQLGKRWCASGDIGSPRSANATPSSGSNPAGRFATGQRALAGITLCFATATKQARASEDFPLPDAPAMAKKQFNGWPSVTGSSSSKAIERCT